MSAAASRHDGAAAAGLVGGALGMCGAAYAIVGLRYMFREDAPQVDAAPRLLASLALMPALASAAGVGIHWAVTEARR